MENVTGAMKRTPCAAREIENCGTNEVCKCGKSGSRGTAGTTSRVRRVSRTDKATGAMKHALRARWDTLCVRILPAARARKRPIGSYGPIGLGAQMRTGRVPEVGSMKQSSLICGGYLQKSGPLDAALPRSVCCENAADPNAGS